MLLYNCLCNLPYVFVSISHSTETFPTSCLADDVHFSISGPNSYGTFSGRGVRRRHCTAVSVHMKEKLTRRGYFGTSSLSYLVTLTKKLSLVSRIMEELFQSVSCMGKCAWVRIWGIVFLLYFVLYCYKYCVCAPVPD